MASRHTARYLQALQDVAVALFVDVPLERFPLRNQIAGAVGTVVVG